jgi:ankyrin repeat protein
MHVCAERAASYNCALLFQERHYGNSALHMAAQRGDYEAVELLVEAGADPTVNNGAQYTPADVARVEDGDVQVLELMNLNFSMLRFIARNTA